MEPGGRVPWHLGFLHLYIQLEMQITSKAITHNAAVDICEYMGKRDARCRLVKKVQAAA
jgi:hypothetical protein